MLHKGPVAATTDGEEFLLVHMQQHETLREPDTLRAIPISSGDPDCCLWVLFGLRRVLHTLKRLFHYVANEQSVSSGGTGRANACRK